MHREKGRNVIGRVKRRYDEEDCDEGTRAMSTYILMTNFQFSSRLLRRGGVDTSNGFNGGKLENATHLSLTS